MVIANIDIDFRFRVWLELKILVALDLGCRGNIFMKLLVLNPGRSN